MQLFIAAREPTLRDDLSLGFRRAKFKRTFYPTERAQPPLDLTLDLEGHAVYLFGIKKVSSLRYSYDYDSEVRNLITERGTRMIGTMPTAASLRSMFEDQPLEGEIDRLTTRVRQWRPDLTKTKLSASAEFPVKVKRKAYRPGTDVPLYDYEGTDHLRCVASLAEPNDLPFLPLFPPQDLRRTRATASTTR